MPETARARARAWLRKDHWPEFTGREARDHLRAVCDEADALAAERDQLKADLEQRRMALIWGESPDDEF